MEKNKGGRPTAYTEELGAEICSRVAEGTDIKAVCDELEIGFSTMHAWREKFPAFQESYARARSHSGEASESRVQQIMDDARTGAIDASVARVLLEGERWLAAKRAPRSHGDKVEIEHSGCAGGLGPVQINIMAHQPVAPEVAGQGVPTAAVGVGLPLDAPNMPGVVCQIRSTQDEGA